MDTVFSIDKWAKFTVPDEVINEISPERVKQLEALKGEQLFDIDEVKISELGYLFRRKKVIANARTGRKLYVYLRE